MTICMLGRQPELGLAELEMLYGSDHVRPVGETCALVDAAVDFKRLGGSIKAAEFITSISSVERSQVFKKVARLLPAALRALPAEGKVKLGLSTYGFDISPYELSGEALRLKKIIRGTGRSVRVVPNEAPALSSAQTYHNSLAGNLGMELVIVRDGDKTLVGRVTDVQDIDSYRIRDRERPKRDAFVGMLPPKLAQIIVNLAVGDTKPGVILDPFCGTGVILQEALLMGYEAYGSDLSGKMVDYTKINLEWLKKSHDIPAPKEVVLADATSYQWNLKAQNVVIATETYLGQPLGGQHPTEEKLAAIVHETNGIVKEFLKNIVPQLEHGARLCVAVPAWFVNETTTRLPVTNELASLGLICHTFSNDIAPLIYHREDQITGRELLVLTKE